ncbi:MAG: hypothetical protein WBV94_31880 [Blastocatellia bacterium]
MSNLKAKVLKFEKLSKHIPKPITSYTKRELFALGPDKLFELVHQLSDKQLDWILETGSKEEQEWLHSRSMEELEAIISGDLIPPFDSCQQW